MVCPNCGMNNIEGNKVCNYCGGQINQNNIISTPPVQVNPKIIKIIVNVILVMVLGIWFLLGTVFTLVSGIPMIVETIKTLSYEKTSATLVEYVDCEISEGDELCTGKYTFTVAGTTYEATPNLLTNRDAIPKTDTVYYDKNNPEKNIIKVNMLTTLIIGIVILSFVISIFVIVNKTINKKLNNVKALN